MIRLARLLLCLATCWPALTLAEESTPLFDYRQITLDNGMKVVSLEDFSSPIVAVQLWYHVGSKNEDPTRQGFAHMFEHMMFRGTDRLGPTDHFDLIRKTGGTANGYTSFDKTVYLQTVTADQLELILWLEAERMGFLTIDEESFDTERKVVEEERRLRLNRPYGTVYEASLKEIFKVHPYRWAPIGKIAHLRAATVDELRHFWQTFYVPNNAALLIVGAVKHEKAQHLARKYFGWMKRAPDPPRVKTREPMPTTARTATIRQKIAPAPVVVVVHRTVEAGHDDAIAVQMLAEIIGGGRSSRLYQNLVTKESVAVQATAWANGMEHAGGIGAWAVLPQVGGDLDQATESIKQQLQLLRQEPVSDLELIKARNQLLRQVVTTNLEISSKARFLGEALLVEGELKGVNTYLDRVRAVTADDLLRVARTYLDPETSLSIRIIAKTQPVEPEPPPAALPPHAQEPVPAKPGLVRPKGFPDSPPLAKVALRLDKPAGPARILPNGLRLVVVENHEVPFVSMTLRLLAGGWAEPKPAVAAFAARMLTRGTADYSSAELAQALETYAIEMAGDATMDATNITASCLSEHFQRTMDLLGQIVLEPTFPTEQFEKLQAQILTQLAVKEKDAAYLADRELRRRLFGDHPYARSAESTSTAVRNLKVENMAPWWNQCANPAEAILVIAGDVNPDDATAAVARTFAHWKPADPSEGPSTTPAVPTATHIYLVNRPNAVQSQIRIGQLGVRRTDPRYFTTRMINGYFGSAFGSRLMRSLRVEKGLTYGARGGYSARRFAGTFIVRTFSKTESTAAAVTAAMEQLERLQSEPPSDRELSTTITFFQGSFARYHETPQSVADDLMLLETQHLPRTYFQDLLEAVAATDADDCTSVVRQTLDPRKMVVVVVGDAGKLRMELAKIAPVTVVKGK